MSVTNLYQLFLKHPLVCTDTRKIQPNCLFFALKGPTFNGNHFAMEALKSGAAYCIIDEEPTQADERLIQVPDVLETLQKLANHHRKQLNIPVIAIVGSNGKTTTKELIYAVLNTSYQVLATPGNFNNHIGLPLTLLQLNQHHQIAIIEMGANHIGENALLCEIAEPSHGLVTNNGMDHLEGFGSIEGVAKSNSELYYYLLKNNGIAFVNAHDEWLMRMATRLNNNITYAGNTLTRNAAANVVGNAHTVQPQLSFEVEHHPMQSILSGDYNFDNIMAAVAIGKHFNLTLEHIAKGIASYVPSNNRSQWLQHEENIIFMDAYNANPSSMEAALRNFAQFNHNNKLIVLGDMFEMGEFAAQEHQRMVDLCSTLGFKKVWLVGVEFNKTLAPAFEKFLSTNDAVAHLKMNQHKGYAIFLKGSRGMKLETLTAFIP